MGPSNSTSGPAATFAYGFDAANQITSYNGPDGALTYTYDSSGEVTAVGSPEASRSLQRRQIHWWGMN
jgi:YD repeat-containing protein